MYSDFKDAFIDLINRTNTTAVDAESVISVMMANGWMGYYQMKRAVVKDFYKRKIEAGETAKDARIDTCIEWGVSESYVKSVIYPKDD